MRFLVLGAGQQGCAAAFDLCRNGDVERVLLADLEPVELPAFLEPYREGKLSLHEVDASDGPAVASLVREVDSVACALPYRFNLSAARLAIEGGAHFCDLGGNTEIVRSQRDLDAEAREAGVGVIPDCGLAPGLVNVLVQAGIDALDRTDSVIVRVGGLPQEPRPPLGYQIVYSLRGVLDYYTTEALVLEDGEPARVPALSGVETVSFAEPVGELEAFHTGGGISTLPYRYRGRIRSMSYKTLRYPGHAAAMRAIRDLGLLDVEPVEVGGCKVVPRDLFVELAEPRLSGAEGRDLVVARVEVAGIRHDVEKTVRWDFVDRYDEERGMTAMTRATGFSLAVTALMQVDGRIGATGVRTPDECIPPDAFVHALHERGLHVERTDF